MVTVYDKDGNEFQKEPVDAKECVALLGFSYSLPEPEVIPEPEAKPAKTK